MGDGCKLGCFRFSDLQRDHGFAQLACAGGKPFQRLDAVEAFDMETDGGDARILEHGAGDVGKAVCAWLPAVMT